MIISSFHPPKSSVVFALVATAIVVSGCGGRAAHPISATNPADSAFDCAGMRREFEANERQVLATVKERSDAQGKNVVLGTAGVLLFWPALFFMDPKSPEKLEIDALRNRNQVLGEIAKSKKCPAPQSKLADVYKKLDTKPSQADTSRKDR